MTRAPMLAGVLLLLLSTTTPVLAAGDDPKAGQKDGPKDQKDPKDPKDPKEAQKEAQALFAQALKLAESGDLRGAITSFQAAYDRSPSFRVLYNIAQLCERVGDSACAVRVYEQYLRDGGTNIPAKRRTEVEADVQKLSRSVARVTITTNVNDANVLVDEQPIGRTPLPTPIPLNEGDHKIVIRTDAKSVDRIVKVAAGESVAVDLQMPKDEPPTPPPIEKHTDDKTTSKTHREVPIAPWAVTGVLAVGTVVTGILASGAYSTFKEKRDAFPVTRSELDDAQGKARDLFLLTALLGTVTVVSAGVASYFTFIAAPSTPPTNAARSRSRNTELAFAIGPGSVVLQGTLP